MVADGVAKNGAAGGEIVVKPYWPAVAVEWCVGLHEKEQVTRFKVGDDLVRREKTRDQQMDAGVRKGGIPLGAVIAHEVKGRGRKTEGNATGPEGEECGNLLGGKAPGNARSSGATHEKAGASDAQARARGAGGGLEGTVQAAARGQEEGLGGRFAAVGVKEVPEAAGCGGRGMGKAFDADLKGVAESVARRAQAAVPAAVATAEGEEVGPIGMVDPRAVEEAGREEGKADIGEMVGDDCHVVVAGQNPGASEKDVSGAAAILGEDGWTEPPRGLDQFDPANTGMPWNQARAFGYCEQRGSPAARGENAREVEIAEVRGAMDEIVIKEKDGGPARRACRSG